MAAAAVIAKAAKMNFDIDDLIIEIYEGINVAKCECHYREKITDPYSTGDHWFVLYECNGDETKCPEVKVRLKQFVAQINNYIEGEI